MAVDHARQAAILAIHACGDEVAALQLQAALVHLRCGGAALVRADRVRETMVLVAALGLASTLHRACFGVDDALDGRGSKLG